MTTAPKLLELPATLRWFGRPALGASTGLRGHVTVLLLWRLGCVHSRQALAELVTVQREFHGRAVAVLAVHTPVAAAERDDARLARTLARLPAPLTIAVDADHTLLRAFGGTSLPLLVVADAAGTVVFHGRGEPFRTRLVDAVEALLQRAEILGAAARVPFAACEVARGTGILPTAIAAADDGLWVAAAGHRRVYQVGRDGAVLRAFGSGLCGATDGGAGSARFVEPTGLLVRGAQVLVADAGGHTVRAIDRTTGTVSTLCGTGRRSTDRIGGGFGNQQGLATPHSLAPGDGGVILAQAGSHQLWQFDPETLACSAWLGSGTRSLVDGGEGAAFAEPLGLGAGGASLYVADAGNGALRHVDLGHNFVRTIARDLLRPAAVAEVGSDVLVAASWQPAVSRVHEGGATDVWVDDGEGLVEPTGLAVDDGRVWIADVGADCLFVGDPAQRRLQRIDLRGAPPLSSPAADPAFATLAAPLRLSEAADVMLRIDLPCDDDERLDTSAPCDVDVVDEATPVLASDRHAVAAFEAGCATLLCPVGERGAGALRIRVQATVRRGAEAVPRQRTWRYVVPVEVGPDGVVDAVVRAAVLR
jgi:hypothetical protein